MEATYLKIINAKQEYLGERYFKVIWEDNHVVQVMYRGSPTGGRGKSQAIGCYLVSKITFIQNYMNVGYVTESNKKEFEEKFDQVIKMIK